MTRYKANYSDEDVELGEVLIFIECIIVLQQSGVLLRHQDGREYACTDRWLKLNFEEV